MLKKGNDAMKKAIANEETRNITLNETAFFLMDHTDWKKELVDQGQYLGAVYYYSEPQKHYIDEASAERQIQSIWNECSRKASTFGWSAEIWEEWDEKCSNLKIPYTLESDLMAGGDDWETIITRLERGLPLTDIIHAHYKAAKEVVYPKVCALVGGPEAVREITEYALSIASRDYEEVYSRLVDKYQNAHWYR